MNSNIWNLDKNTLDNKGIEFLSKFKNSENKTKFKVGQKITFLTGYNNDILASATIKAIDVNDIYIYNDAYWFPILDEKKRNIKNP